MCPVAHFSSLNCLNFAFLWPTHGPHMVLTWSSHGSSHWFSLNLNDGIQGGFIPILSVLASILNRYFQLSSGGRDTGSKFVSEKTKI